MTHTLPDPHGGCCCTVHPPISDPAEPHISYPPELEYEPACPVHSTHLYNPRSGVWVSRLDPLAEELNALTRRARWLRGQLVSYREDKLRLTHQLAEAQEEIKHLSSQRDQLLTRVWELIAKWELSAEEPVPDSPRRDWEQAHAQQLREALAPIEISSVTPGEQP